MIRCTNCGHPCERDWTTCPECNVPIVSVAPDSLDTMVEAASIPSLSALFKRAKQKGAITSNWEYGGKAV